VAVRDRLTRTHSLTHSLTHTPPLVPALCALPLNESHWPLLEHPLTPHALTHSPISMSSDTHSLTQKEQESTHVMCIGTHVLTGVVLPPPHSTDHPVSEAVSEQVNNDISHTVLQTFSLCSEGIATTVPSPRVSECVSEREREIDVASIRSLFRNFYSSLDTTQRLSRSVNLHLVVPTQLMGYHKNIILEEARGVAGNLNVCSIHSTAASLCVAAFSENLPHTAPNILCTVEGTRGYCEWDPQPNGNQQRIDILSSHDGIMRVLVVEVSKGKIILLSLGLILHI
jgi:hypothetical protein